MSSPHTRLEEAEKQLGIVAEQLADDRKANVAEELATLVRLFAEGVDDEHVQDGPGEPRRASTPEGRP